ncbi:hypothetical protein AJ78_04316 [Emergomyces pasteurianus Ep9510]|uniref:von Willebrand domain-containing protein n=1 Tax=Emergomyces pasteurianus Ep9510 TaxID=1447872 RepID=A0A1J9PGA2_9EURO|nr:hypothetical protein AJ78_04316 [Emergomyces pasteurianus Ep9510]
MYPFQHKGQTPCGCWYWLHQLPQYIPQVDLKAHTTILSESSRTTLTQTFINPTTEELQNVKYTFPLHDGVTVVGFKCEIDNRVIHGCVKERMEAKAEYQEAVKKALTAALFEQSTLASDVFTTSIGKIPVGSKAVVEITYLGELQHDAQADGVRFSIPSVICPRYANSSVNTHELSQSLATLVRKGAISITVDVSVDKGSCIRGLQSPSHPIAISLGRTSDAAQDVFEANLASATLRMQQDDLFFDKDFVLIVNAKDQDVPSAFVERHPTIPNQRAVMATIVPKFNLPNNNPEIVFIIDRSGSMAGKMKTLQAALQVFLKSLPVGVKFNICSFGSTHSFMWKKSKTYDASSLKAALKYVESVDADFGGTEILKPVRATVENRFKDLDLDVLLLSDGEIWDQETLFSYINNAVTENPIRFFSLGIGNGASQSLIEGIARAGDGFAQFVTNNEQLDKKVVRMLKGALTPHIKDYTAEVVYENDGEDDFEIIEKPNEIPTAENFRPPAKRSQNTMDVDSQEEVPQSKKPISLYDPSYQESGIKSDAVVSPETNLPELQPPKVLQAPYKIPSLYPFSRTTVYFLLSPGAPGTALKSLVLRGTSKHGPLMLNIPLEDIGQGTRLHQLAARKLTLELEEGRGWVYHAKNGKGQLIIDEHESKKENIVKREAVRLGIQFQVAGKYCSFVAVESTNGQENVDQEEHAKLNQFTHDSDSIDDESSMKSLNKSENISEFPSTHGPSGAHAMSNLSISSPSSFRTPPAPSYYSPLAPPSGHPPPPPPSGSASPFFSSFSAPPAPNTASPFGTYPTDNSPRSGFGGPPARRVLRSSLSGSGSSFGSAPIAPGQVQFHAAQSTTSAIDNVLERGEVLGELVHKSDALGQQAVQFRSKRKRAVHSKEMSLLLPAAARGVARFFKADGKKAETEAKAKAEPAKPSNDKVHALISLQSFEGSWQWDDNVFAIMEFNSSKIEREVDWASILGKQPGVDIKNAKQRSIVATLLVLAYLNKKYLNEKETWELVEDKAMAWAIERIKEIGGNSDRGPEELLSLFDGLL